MHPRTHVHTHCVHLCTHAPTYTHIVCTYAPTHPRTHTLCTLMHTRTHDHTHAQAYAHTHTQYFILCVHCLQLFVQDLNHCLATLSPGTCCDFTSKNSGEVELKSVTTRSVDKQNPAYTDVDPSEPTAEPQCKESAAGEGSDEVIDKNPA